MATTLKDLAALLAVAHVGPDDTAIRGLRDIERLGPDDALEDGFVYFVESPAVLKRHPKAAANGVILTVPKLAAAFPRALVAPEGDARLVFIRLLGHLAWKPAFKAGVDPKAVVHPSAKVAPDAVVLPGAVVMEGAVVGPRCVLYPGAVVEPFAVVGEGSELRSNVVLGHHCAVGADCLIHGGTVIGADGFGFYDRPGARHKIPHIGNVVIGDHVELGAGCTVDRATIETTSIGAHTKFDDQVHVGHNCRVGRFVYIVGNSAVGGSVVIEDGAMISGMVIVKDHLRIAKGTVVMGFSGVAQDTEPGGMYFGAPARPARQMHKMHAALERLPELLVKVRELEAKVAALAPTAA